LATAGYVRGHSELAVEAASNAIEHARLAGQRHTGSFGLAQGLLFGPRPADDGIETLDSLFPGTSSPGPLSCRARLLAMLGRFEEARAIAEEVAQRTREYTGWEGAGSPALAEIAILEGDYETAVHYLRLVCDRMEEIGQPGFLSTYAPLLGRSLLALGRYEEAEPLSYQGRDLGDEDDVETQMLWRRVLALVHAHKGQTGEAEVLVQEAIAIADRTDSLNGQADARCDLAEVLIAAGRTADAAEALEQALERYAQKKNLAMIAQVQPKLEALRAHVS